MFAWINIVLLLICAFAILLLYVQSASPEAREQLTGDPDSFRFCGVLRKVSIVPMAISSACYVAYCFAPLPVPLPVHFPWLWTTSILLGLLIISISSCIVMVGVLAAGKEALEPQKDGALYEGIYKRIRHPQFYEVFSWFGFALLLHSPFLFLFSFIYVPIWVLMVQAEERDLILRFGTPYVEYYRRTGALIPRIKTKTGKIS